MEEYLSQMLCCTFCATHSSVWICFIRFSHDNVSANLIIKPAQCASSHLARLFDFELVSIRIHQTSVGVDGTNSVLRLVCAFECALIHITSASVDMPLESILELANTVCPLGSLLGLSCVMFYVTFAQKRFLSLVWYISEQTCAYCM